MRLLRLNIFLPSKRSRDGKRLGWIGVSWRQTPIRRISQLLFLILFLILFFHTTWVYTGNFRINLIQEKEWIPAELFLQLDPMVGVGAALSARALNSALIWFGAIFLLSLFLPRFFCSYVCPMGTLIDASDAILSRRNVSAHRFHRLRFLVLIFVVACSALGFSVAGYVSPIPILTRGLLSSVGYLQLWVVGDLNSRAVFGTTQIFSVVLLLLVLGMGVLGKRFWCRYLCPSGAFLSLLSLFRLVERKVDASCVSCGRCVVSCHFDAIRGDFSTRHLNCTSCQLCGGVCPTGAISFERRRREPDLDDVVEPAEERDGIGRRAFLISGLIGASAGLGMRRFLDVESIPIRPPGSVPEDEFLSLCVRCGECMRACPGPALNPVGLEYGLERLATPAVVPIRAGCHPDCNFCSQVCPTGAIHPLSIDEKRRVKIGTAIIDTNRCLAHVGERDCRFCYEECRNAGYKAITMKPIPLDIGEIPPGVFSAVEIDEMSHIEAPFIDANACVGCGMCENRCHREYVLGESILKTSAVQVKPRVGT